MKEGYLEKSFGAPDESALGQINRLSRRALTADEVYTFSVVLCDNEIDRDFERFTVAALNKLAELYVGKTGIFDHSMHGRDQVARIYACEVERVDGKTTAAGEAYHRLKAYAYMPRTERNADLITEIDAGIKKEVSVGCATASKTCSVCGADLRRGTCAHIKGRKYKSAHGGTPCHAILDEPTDAYEFSFVAVPAQRGAGVVKSFSEDRELSDAEINEIAKALGAEEGCGFDAAETVKRFLQHARETEKLAKAYRAELEEETLRLCLLAQPEMPREVAEAATKGLEADELRELKAVYEQAVCKLYPFVPQLAAESGTQKAKTGKDYII